MTTPHLSNKLPSDEALVALYKEALNHDAPSLELDNAILAAAHKAVDAKPLATNQKSSFTRRWQLPMSIAATVVISASLVLLTPRENPALMPPTMHTASEAPPTAASSAPATQASAPMKRDEAEAKVKAEYSNANTRDKNTQQLTRKNESLNAKPFSDSPEPAVAAASSEAETPAAEEKSQISEPNQTMAAPAAIKTEAITDKIRRAASNDIIPSDSAMASSYKQAKTHTPKKEVTDANSKEMAVEDSPELWLKNIGDLRQKGELDAAHKSLDTFKLRYPDYKLPKDLMEFEK